MLFCDILGQLSHLEVSQCRRTIKNPPGIQDPQETQVLSQGQEDPLEEGMVTHSSILAGEFHGQRSPEGYSHWGRKDLDMTKPGTGEPGGPPSMGSHRVGHD